MAHVKVGTRDRAFCSVWRHNLTLLEVDLHFTLAIAHAIHAIPLTEIVVRAITVYFTNGRCQVVKVGFHGFEYFVIASAVLATTILPTLTLVAELPSWNHMFPLNPTRSLLLFSDLITTAIKVGNAFLFVLPCNVTATIK
ncbi:conserved membrane hypothetical protein [Vibrio coralliirubri]|nr:conserved membrane hypothetical protein [Vibrio coralliirubri]